MCSSLLALRFSALLGNLELEIEPMSVYELMLFSLLLPLF